MKPYSFKLALFFLVAVGSQTKAAGESGKFKYMLEWRLARAFKTSPKIKCIDERGNGYKFFRMGAPSRKDMVIIKKLEIKKIIVLSNDAELFERKYSSPYEGPELLVYDQRSEIPLDDNFKIPLGSGAIMMMLSTPI